MARKMQSMEGVMRKLLLLSCLAASVFASADDADMRAMLQAKYTAVDASMNEGDLRALGKVCDQGTFVALDIQKKRTSLPQMLNALDQKKNLQIKTSVESADTLAGMAKAALRITTTQV